MSANSLNKLKEIPITSDIIKSIEECTSDNSSESLLDAEKLINYEDKLAEHLTVYDEPVITPPSEHIEYPGGIPPYEIQAQIVLIILLIIIIGLCLVKKNADYAESV